MSSMNKTKEEINLKKLLLRRKNTGSIFVIAGLLTIFVIPPRRAFDAAAH